MEWKFRLKNEVDAPGSRTRVAFVAFLVGVALSIISILAVYSTREQIRATLADLRINRDVDSAARALLAAVVDTETSLRGFLLSRDDSFLAPFQSARESIPANAARLREGVVRYADLDAPARRFLDDVSTTFNHLQDSISRSRSNPIERDAIVALISEIKARLDRTREAHALLSRAIDIDLTARRDRANDVLSRLLQTVVVACAGLALGAYAQVRELGKMMSGAKAREGLNRREIEALSRDLNTSQYARDELARRMHLALATARVKVFSLRADGMLEWVSEPSIGLVRGIELPAPLQELTTPEDRQFVAGQVREALATNTMVDFEMRTGADFPGPSWFKITISPADRTASGSILGAAVDISVIKEREQGNFWLTRELMHRSRNLMSILQSMATHSARAAASPREFNERFIDRLHAISRVQDLLIANGYARVSLRELIVSQMVGLVPPQLGKVMLAGEDIDLNPDATHALGMALHELFVNSRARGALANTSGVLSLSWSRESDGAGETLVIAWLESGAEAGDAPIADGFGRFLVAVNLPRAMGGAVEFTTATDGTRCEIRLPMTKVRAHGRSG